MDPFFQTVLTSVITGGSFTAILAFAQFLIKRSDDKKDKKSGVQAELQTHGEQLDNLTKMVAEGGEEQKAAQKKTQEQLKAQGDAIAGLEHDRIIHAGKGYLKQGRISLEDYDDINNYLFKPYQKLGGNGTAADIMERLKEMVEGGDRNA